MCEMANKRMLTQFLAESPDEGFDELPGADRNLAWQNDRASCQQSRQSQFANFHSDDEPEYKADELLGTGGS